MKIKKQKYYSLTNILKENCEYNILLGERSNGKSYAVKHFCINDYLENGNMFIYLRRYAVESRNMMVESYFNDVDVSKVTNGQYKYITVYRSGIYFANENEKGDIVREVQIGMVMSLSLAQHYKSMSLLAYKNIIFEEMVSKTLYIPNECNELQQLVSTIARRERIRVFMIGNTISRLCPYFSEWQLIHIPTQKQGTIDIYNMKTDQVDEDTGESIVIHIAVEFCENSGNNSKMFFGSVGKSITNGSWETEVQPHIPYPYEDCELLYSLTIIRFNMMYVCSVLKHDSEYFIFVHPSNKVRTDRVIQDDYSSDMLITKKLVELTKGDRVMRYLIKLNKICYSDNLTGSEFSNNILPTL